MATCPFCQTVDRTLTPDALMSGGTWECTSCRQMWSAARLQTARAYARFVALHPPAVTGTATERFRRGSAAADRADPSTR